MGPSLTLKKAPRSSHTSHPNPLHKFVTLEYCRFKATQKKTGELNTVKKECDSSSDVFYFAESQSIAHFIIIKSPKHTQK